MPERVDVEPGSPEWAAARRAGVTATDIVTICGLSSTDSAYALYWRKLGVIPEAGDSDRFRLGRELEPYIAKRWGDETGRWAVPGGLWRSTERPWQMATLDRMYWTKPPAVSREHLLAGLGDHAHAIITPDPAASVEAVLELKSWADADRARWDDGPPPAVRAQVLWQMDTLAVAIGHVGVLFLPSGEFRSYVIEHNGNCHSTDVLDLDDSKPPCPVCDLTEVMRLHGMQFMNRLAENDPPSPDGSAATLAALKARFTDPRNDKTAPVLPDLWGAYEYHLDETAKHKAKAKEGEALIRDIIGEAGLIEVDGEIVARRQRYTVKAHQRKASMVDKLTRVKRKDDDDDTN